MTDAEDALLRVEDARLVTGRGQFIHNIAVHDMLHAVFLRSSHADAAFKLNLADARTSPDVVAIFQASDFPDVSMPAHNPLVAAAHDFRAPLLGESHVAFVGQPIALVIAKSQHAATAAIAAIDVVYSAVENKSPSIAPLFSLAFDTREKSAIPAAQISSLQVAFSQAQPRVCAMTMEPRACIAQWDDNAQKLTAWVGTQAVSRARDSLAQTLQIPLAAVRVIAPDVGGAFGAKASLYPEELLIALAAQRLRTCIKWMATRSEDFLAATQGRGSTLSATLSFTEAGDATALTANFHFPLGAWLAYSAVIPMRNAARILPGPYRIDNVHIAGNAALSAHAPVNIYRGAGRPEAAMMLERLCDLAAKKIAMDAVAFRHRNFIRADEMPHHSATGETLDSGDYDAVLRQACAAFEYEAARKSQATRRAQGEIVGIGVAMYVEPCGSGWESARVTLHSDGRAEVASGSSAQGQGHETTYARIASQILLIPTAQISVIHGDTDRAPEGIGALASRSIAIGGSAVMEAAQKVKSLRDAGHALPITAESKYTATMEAWSCGAVIAQMSIDRDTGVPTIERIIWADDAGQIISPDLAKGQLLGGLAQGIGQAMMEEMVYDEEGQLRTGSLMDYAIPRADDMPPVTLVSAFSVTRANVLGAKGVGEAGCIGVPAALLNAACDALHAFDTADLSFPLTSEKLWAAMRQN